MYCTIVQLYAQEISRRLIEWFAVQPRSKLREENRKSEKSFGVPTTSGALLVAVLVKGALMS